ncbi:MAG: Ig-like domain-containing protein [Roseobacter sp.]
MNVTQNLNMALSNGGETDPEGSVFDLQDLDQFRSEVSGTGTLNRILASGDEQYDTSADISFTKGLFGSEPTTDDIPFVEVNHISSCGCAGCGGFPTEEMVLSAAVGADDVGNELGGGAVSAPSPLGDMADFLTTGFWGNFGTVPREFNLTNSGVNAKSGVLHYNVSGFSNAGSAGTDTDGISSARADLVRDALDVFGEVLGINFVETSSSDTNFTDLFFKDTDAGRAYANSTGFSEGVQYSWVNISQDWSGGTSTYNDYTLQTIFHEVGHALGLGHQGLYNGSGSYSDDADFENDSWQASMMSYFSQNENTTIPASFAYLQTPMAVDWIALQDIYGDQSFGGTNFGVNNAFLGNTVYGFNTNISASTSRIWSEYATYADDTASTIIDGGGIDTLDFSGYSANQLINLTPSNQAASSPSISNIGGLTGNLTLAEGTIIENAIGGSGSDSFFGNDADNVFTGNAGNDIFNDSLGNDSYFGGTGSDTVDFLGLAASYSFSFSGVFLSVINVATDLVENTVEFLSFDDGLFSFQSILDGLDSNSAPVANNDFYLTNEASILTGGSVLQNDSDEDGDTLSVESVNGAVGNVGGQITLASGALLTVNENGTFTYDPNGAFDALNDGQSAVDSFTYTATDDSDTSNAATVSITVDGVDSIVSNTAFGESGVANVTQSGANQWHQVSFAASISNAVVVMGPATNFDDAPLTTRVRNVTDTGFEFQIDEWDYQDGFHGAEDIGWLAVSEGSHVLSSGETIVAANASVDGSFTAVNFGETLNDAVVLAEISSSNAPNAVAARIQGVTGQGFQAQIQQEEAGGVPSAETISWIAIEAGQNALFEAFVTPDEVRLTTSSYRFASAFAAAPVVLADMQTADGEDTSTTRLAALDQDGVSLFIQEEQSNDAELFHTTESVGIVALTGGLLYSDEQPNSAPDGQNDAVSVAEDAPLLIDVLANDTDVDGDLLEISEIEGQTISVGQTVALDSGALVTLNADQTLSYDQNGVFTALNTGQNGTDTFTYTVVDGDGGVSGADVTVTVQGVDEVVANGAIGQSGVATVGQTSADQWHSISFDAVIENAVVVLGPVTRNDADQVTTRLRNVTDTGFEFQIDEWDYLDGLHGVENVGWLAMSEGSHTLNSGQTIVASTATIGTGFSVVSFGETLDDAVVFTEVSSVNEADAVGTRIRNVTDQDFRVQLEEEEAGGAHVAETVSWIAIESGAANGLEVVRTDDQVDENADTFVFNQPFSDAPVLIADMQSTDGGDTSTLRLSALDSSSVSLFVEEEQSANAEIAHSDEVAGYVALQDGLIYLDSFLV